MNKMKHIHLNKRFFQLLMIMQLAVAPKLFAQNIAINTTGNAPDTSAMLDVVSTTQGFLMPRMTTAQMNAIILPATGLLVFNTTLNSIEVNTGTTSSPSWAPVTTATSAWSITGNTGTSSTTNFIGTADNQDVIFKRFNVRAGFLSLTNSGWGINSLNSATATGVRNTAFGNSALQNLTTGNANTAFGDSALKATTTGNYNVAVGGYALRNTTGEQNVAVGYGALQLSTTNNAGATIYPNVAVGVNSLGSTTTGYANTATGGWSLYFNNTGNYNVASGYYALVRNTTGSENVAIGTSALSFVTTAGQNVAIGKDALKNEKGPNNVSLGYQTGLNNTGGSGNVFLGNQAGYSETGSNKLYIANTSTTTPLIGGDFSTGFVGIGTAAPSEKLEVAGNLKLNTAGNKIVIATGSNASVGTATLSSGTITINTTAVTANSLIFVTYDTPSGTLGSGLSAPAGSITAGASFVINSLTTAGAVNTSDNSTVRWWIVN